MKNNVPTITDLELTARLAEVMLESFHFKIKLRPDPVHVRGWIETQGRRSEFVSNQWWFDIESDLGKTEVHQTDRFGWDVIQKSQAILNEAYRKLIGYNASQEIVDLILDNDNQWSNKLEELQKKYEK